jgi:3-hydroxyisobutyrate dehydrogenase-like beta-hydroxyacid dehydrogenase
VNTVAVVGTGRMGAAMAGRLRRAGLAVVVFNRTRAKAEQVGAEIGAEVADTPADAAKRADVTLVSLADDAAVTAAYRGPNGLAAGLDAGDVVLETSTIDPSTVPTLAQLVAERGAILLDTPVSGSVSVVEQGQVTVMAGGAEQALDRVRPVLDAFAKQVFHMGGSGTGATMKLAVNSVLYGLNLALAEALVLAERGGVERSRAYEVFAASAIAAPFVHYKRAAFEHPEDAQVAFTLDLVAKDLELIENLAERVNLRLAQLGANGQVARAALEAGYGERDISALAALLRST